MAVSSVDDELWRILHGCSGVVLSVGMAGCSVDEELWRILHGCSGVVLSVVIRGISPLVFNVLAAEAEGTCILAGLTVNLHRL